MNARAPAHTNAPYASPYRHRRQSGQDVIGGKCGCQEVFCPDSSQFYRMLAPDVFNRYASPAPKPPLITICPNSYVAGPQFRFAFARSTASPCTQSQSGAGAADRNARHQRLLISTLRHHSFPAGTWPRTRPFLETISMLIAAAAVPALLGWFWTAAKDFWSVP